ncbi:uncharacterized protein PSFLO_02544 [Pseudozyma flocculosa]|uniref:Secreted protein n=1 Tax=Pseudozyma flocculosa TaxID=84751 RepID=A0A5C3EY98_9BASI|nr:uncharacterized protein PSFLO_02544 [Pseudozyma flocculosa]
MMLLMVLVLMVLVLMVAVLADEGCADEGGKVGLGILRFREGQERVARCPRGGGLGGKGGQRDEQVQTLSSF